MFDRPFDRLALGVRKLFQRLQQRRDAVVGVDARLAERIRMLGEGLSEIGTDGMAEDDLVLDAHHGRLQMD